MRAVPEWIGAHDDAEIPKRVKLRIWTRCEGKCALTGRKLRPGDSYEFDHIQALENKGAHRESNLQLVSSEAHKVKTKADRQEKAKTDRIFAKHNKLWPPSRNPIRSRGFEKSRRIPAEGAR